MSELVERFKTWDKSDAVVSINPQKHPKSGKLQPYFSLTNGTGVTGVFLTDEIAWKMLDVLSKFIELSKVKKPLSETKDSTGASASSKNN